MYLHLGNQIIVLQKSVIGVFDMDTATWSHRTRETLEKLEQAGQVENAAGTRGAARKEANHARYYR